MSAKKTIFLLKTSAVEYFSIIIFSMGIALLSFIQIYFHEVYKYSVMQASILLGSATIGQFFGSLLSSKYVKLMNKLLIQFQSKVCPLHLSIFLLALCLGGLFISFNVTHNYLLFILLSFSLGILLALFSPINMALLTADTDLGDTVIVNFLRRWMLNIGACVAFGVMGYLMNNPHQLFYIVASVFFLISVLELSRLFKDESENHTVKTSINNFDIEHASKSVWLWMLGVFLSYIIFFQTISTYPIFLKDYANIDASHFSRLMIISVVMVLSLQFVTPVLEKRMSISAISAFGTILIGLGIAIVVIPSHKIIVVSVIIWSIGEIFLLGVTPIYAKLFAGNDRDKNLQYSSNYYAVCYLGKIIGPLGGSFIYSHFHWHKTLLVSFFLLSVAVFFCFHSLGVMIEKNNLSK